MAPLIDPRLRLRHIACFLEVARLRSMAGAAAALNISQPAATKTIQELELLLGGKVFDRSRRRLALTPFGETFFRYASTSFGALRQGIEAVRHTQEETVIRVGALPTVSARILPEAARIFATEETGATVRVITGPNAYLLSLLRTGDADLVIGRMAEPGVMPGLAFEHLYFERIVLVVRAGHPILDRGDFSLPLIEPYPLLLPPPESVIYPLVQRLLFAHGLSGRRDRLETVSTSFGLAYVRQTDAIWFISEGVVSNEIEDGRLVRLPVDTSDTTGAVGLTTRIDASPPLATAMLIDAVRQSAARLSPMSNADGITRRQADRKEPPP